MIIFIISLICWLIYSIYEGKREAWLFCSNFTYKQKHDVHFYFMIQRIAAIVPFVLLNADYSDLWLLLISSGILIVIYGGIFVFFYDGFYYLERNNMDNSIYPLRFKDFKDSSAIFDFTWNERQLLFLVSLIISITYMIILIIKS